VQTALVLIVLAAGVALYLWKFKKRLGGDEDRPEIIVRNGKLRIRSGDGENRGKNWKRLTDREWKQDHPEGKSVREYKVTVENAVEAACDGMPLMGDTVTVVYTSNSAEHTVTLLLERDASSINEPTVRSGVDLEHDGGNRKQLKIKLTDPEGGITKVTVGSNSPCTFPKNPNKPVVVELNMNYE
jgi:hypothetical protein